MSDATPAMDAPESQNQPAAATGTLTVRDTAIAPYQPTAQGPFGLSAGRGKVAKFDGWSSTA